MTSVTDVSTAAVKYFIIDEKNVNSLTEEDMQKAFSKSGWHKFVIKNGSSLNKDNVLEAILSAVFPSDFIPVKYMIEDEDSYFLARNCGMAIEKLCSSYLKVSHECLLQPIVISIYICYLPIQDYPINMKDLMKKAIQERLREEDKHLNLCDFHKEPVLYNSIFCPLYCPKILEYVIQMIQPMSLHSINLSHNNLVDIKPLVTLEKMSELQSLDLSYNKITKVKLSNFIEQKAAINLTEVNLMYNPVCAQCNSVTYTSMVLSCFPKLNKLDGCYINRDTKTAYIDSYFYDNTSIHILHQFVQHYFRFYDYARHVIGGCYHDKAIFSITRSDPNTLSSNLDNPKFLSFSVNDISNALICLPSTRHLPKTFKIDAPLTFEGPYALLKVTGIFRDEDMSTEQNPIFRHFDRTFILLSIGCKEYKIINDLYHIGCEVSFQEKLEYMQNFTPFPETPSEHRTCVTTVEMEERITQLKYLTQMKKEYVQKCLEDNDWNLKRSVDVFLKLYKSLDIPVEAFEVEQVEVNEITDSVVSEN